MAHSIEKIAVIGAGTMGSGIAQVAASAGFQVQLFDLNPEVLKKGMAGIQKNLLKAVELGKLSSENAQATLARIAPADDLRQLVCDVVIEAIIEKTEAKQNVFQSLAQINPPTTIFASNTSSIPITRIARGIPHPERVVGMHFFNPAHLMKLVEVISGEATSAEVAQTVAELSTQMGKTPVMAADAPGFIVNRVARHFYLESLKCLEERVTDFATIDALMENSGFKMGPFKLQDLIGMDINFSVTSSMFDSFHGESRFRPSRLQEMKVEGGFLGKKTGK
ncbi:MAG: 3-hydroxyacyl-CoA dehydrogenase NAD-binding domain-containing protein, partial [Bacteroidia bacterium]